MAKVPTVGELQRVAVERGPVVFDTARGADISELTRPGRAIQAAGASIGAAADELSRAVLMEQDRKNKRKAKELETGYRNNLRVLEYGDGENEPGLYSLEGAAAVEAHEEYVARINKLKADTLSQAGNEQLADYLTPAIESATSDVMGRMARHNLVAEESAQLTAHESRLDSFIQDAARNWNDPQAIAKAKRAGSGEIVSFMDGASEEEQTLAVENFLAVLNQEVVRERVFAEKFKSARDYLKQVERQIHRDQFRMLSDEIDAAEKAKLAEEKRAAREAQSKLRASLRRKIVDDLASRQDTGKGLNNFTMAELRFAFEEEEVDEILANQRRAVEFHDIRNVLRYTTPEQDLITLQAVQPDGVGYAAEATFRDQIRQMLQVKYSKRVEDAIAKANDAGIPLEGVTPTLLREVFPGGEGEDMIRAINEEIRLFNDSKRVSSDTSAEADLSLFENWTPGDYDVRATIARREIIRDMLKNKYSKKVEDAVALAQAEGVKLRDLSLEALTVAFGSEELAREAMETIDAEIELYKARKGITRGSSPKEDLEALRSFTPGSNDVAATVARREILRKMIAEKYSAAVEESIAKVRVDGVTLDNFSRDILVEAYGEDEADRLLGEIDAEIATYQAVQKSLAASPAEEVEIIAGQDPDTDRTISFISQQNRQDDVAKIIKEKRKALAEDSAAYVETVLPEVARAFEEAGDDPDAIQTAIQMSLDEQARLGVPPWERHALPKPRAAAIIGQIKALPDAQAKVDWVQQTAQLYGDAWPTVYGDLVEYGLPAEMAVVASMDNPAQNPGAVHMMEAFETGDKTLTDLIGKETKSNVEDNVRAELEGFKATLAQVPGGPSTYAQFERGAILSAMLYTARGHSEADAAARAANDVANSRYSYAGTLRIPKKYEDEAIPSRLKGYQRNTLKNLDLVVPFADPRLPVEEVRSQYASSVAEYGYWVANEDETGAVLFDHEGRRVMQRTKPQYLMGYELAQLGLSEQEKRLVDYHRNSIETNTVGTGPGGEAITIYGLGIKIGEGLYVSVPGWVEGRILTERQAYDYWKDEIEAGQWPIYDSPEAINRRSREIHTVMERESPKLQPIILNFDDIPSLALPAEDQGYNPSGSFGIPPEMYQ